MTGTFEQFISRLTSMPPSSQVIIKGVNRQIKGMVKLTSINLPDNTYLKLTFTDGSFLLIMLNDQEFYFEESLIEHIKEISDESIGIDTEIIYNNKVYVLVNPNDYQYVLQRYLGGIDDVEGEARFSDYLPKSGQKEFLSLGWLSHTGKRADINPIWLDSKDIDIIKK